MSDVRLVDLDVIKRYSLAVRQEWVPAEEILAVLEASRQQVLAAAEPEPDPDAEAGAEPEPRGRRRRERTPGPITS